MVARPLDVVVARTTRGSSSRKRRRRRRLLWALTFLATLALRWSSESSLQTAAEYSLLLASTLSSTASSPPSLLWTEHRDGEGTQDGFFWESNSLTDQCLLLENVCRRRNDPRRWFYRSDRHASTSSSTASSPSTSRQPSVLWDTGTSDPRSRYVQFLANSDGTAPPNDSCPFSNVTNHIVLSTQHSNVAEFYDKTVTYLHLLHDRFAPWLHGAQVYLQHVPPSTLLPSAPSRWWDPYVDLYTAPFRSRPLMSAEADLLIDGMRHNEEACQCYARLILCGYEITSDTDSSVSSTTPSVPATLGAIPEIGEPNKRSTPNGENAPTNNPLVTVRPGTGWGNPQLRRYYNRPIREAMQATWRHHADEIRRYREALLDRHNVSAADWPTARIVGLVQQRRRAPRWRNLTTLRTILQRRLDNANQTIILVEVDADDVAADLSPLQLLVRYAALDGLIGLHGPALAHAAAMRDGAWFVELLPWLPPQASAADHSARVVHRATSAVGDFFTGTSLNHVGYRLPRKSAPYCSDGNASSSPSVDTSCWKQHRWDERDFVVEESLLQRVLAEFITNEATTQSGVGAVQPALLCPNLIDRTGQDIVLYNVNCAVKLGVPTRPLAFTWECSKGNYYCSPPDYKVLLWKRTPR